MTLVLCNEAGPAKNDQPCPREKGHKDEHYTWHQFENDHVTVVTFAGERIYHLNIRGKVNQDEVGAMVAFLDWVAENKRP